MELDDARKLVATWAADERIIARAYFFGSRVKGTNNTASDIDVAIELVFSEPNTALAHWFSHRDRWQSHLNAQLPWNVDLQFLDLNHNAVVTKGVDEAAILVFERAVA